MAALMVRGYGSPNDTWIRKIYITVTDITRQNWHPVYTQDTTMCMELAVLTAQKSSTPGCAYFLFSIMKVLIGHKNLKTYVPRKISNLLYLFLSTGNFSKLHHSKTWNMINVWVWIYIYIYDARICYLLS